MLLQGAQIETTRHRTGKIRTLCLLCALIDQREVLKIHRLSGDNTVYTTGRSAEEENANKNGRKSKFVACVLRAPIGSLLPCFPSQRTRTQSPPSSPDSSLKASRTTSNYSAVLVSAASSLISVMDSDMSASLHHVSAFGDDGSHNGLHLNRKICIASSINSRNLERCLCSSHRGGRAASAHSVTGGAGSCFLG